MRRLKPVLIALLILIVSAVISSAAGLGSTQQEFESEWYRGYKSVFLLGDMGKNVHVGASRDIYLAYITGDAGYSFENPPRVGRINGPGAGVMMDINIQPEALLFFEQVRKLLPPQSKIIAAYSSRNPYLTEKYVFTSPWLKRLPGISQAVPYQSFLGLKGDPVGVFQLIVTYDIKDSGTVASFTLALGRDSNEGMKKLNKNPFK